MPIDEQLMDRLFESPQLPSLPTIALRIIEQVQEDEVDVDKIAETISLDPALSTKMLKTVNSSFYGMSKTVGSVHQAVVVLGLNSVKTLALGFSLVSNLTDAGGDGFDHMSFWRRSLYSATAAKQLCELLNIVQAEEVFMASLLQDVGVLAMAQVLGREYAPLMRSAAEQHRELAALEQDRLGGDHMEVGARLAESWGLPPLLVESIRLHENPDEATENLKPLIRTVAAGGLEADLIDDPVDESRVTDYFSVLEAWFDIEKDSADRMLRTVISNAKEAQRLFDLPTGELGNPDMILEKANDVLSKLEHAEKQKKHGGSQEEAPLAVQAQKAEVGSGKPKAGESTLDKLTGLQNRRRFEEQLDEQFVVAGPDRPISLLYVDLDQFKKVNDLYGIGAGDYVLRSVAETIRSVGGKNAELFRFDDDEFMLLCTGMSRPDATIIAEAIRTAIADESYAVGSDPSSGSASLTVSIGVATYEGALFKRPEQLINAVSKGVFAAKDGGCNVVRIFVPKRAKTNNEAA